MKFHVFAPMLLCTSAPALQPNVHAVVDWPGTYEHEGEGVPQTLVMRLAGGWV